MKRFWPFLAHAPCIIVGIIAIILAPFVLSGCSDDGKVTNPAISNSQADYENRLDEIVIPSLTVLAEINKKIGAERPGASLSERQAAIWMELQRLKADVVVGKAMMIGPLTNAEFWLLFWAPGWYAGTTAYTVSRAQAEANAQWPGNQFNTKADAFRHAFWNELMAKYISISWAQQFSTAHESETPDGNSRRMDLNNNAVGRVIFASNTSKSEAQLATITKNFSYGYRNPINACYSFLVFFQY